VFRLDWEKHFRRLLDGTLAVLILGSLAVTAYYTYGIVLVLLALMWKFGDWISGLEDWMKYYPQYEALWNDMVKVASKNCYNPHAICTCGDITDILEKWLPELKAEADRLGLTKYDGEGD